MDDCGESIDVFGCKIRWEFDNFAEFGFVFGLIPEDAVVADDREVQGG